MKQLILFFALAIMMVSCTSNPEPPQVVNLTAFEQDWAPQTDIDHNIPLYFSCIFDMPEITPYVYEQGSVQTYIYNNGAQQALPCVLHYKNALGERWTLTIDCEYGVGFLKLFYTNSDFSVTDAPATMDFRVVVTR